MLSIAASLLPYFFAPPVVLVVPAEPVAGPVFFAGLAGRLLPNEPLNIFPFLVFLSPLPI
jgi:hypothetical protein